MIDVEIIKVNQLFKPLNKELTDLLKELNPDDWNRPTVCKLWNVKDIVQHLLKDYLLVISRNRDGYRSPLKPDSKCNNDKDLLNFINKLNQDWTETTRAISP